MVAAASVRAAADTTAILPNFSIMTRLPLMNCLPTETSNKAQAGISRPLSRDISQHGESEDRRDFQLLDWPASGPCAVYRRHVTGRGRRVRVTRCGLQKRWIFEVLTRSCPRALGAGLESFSSSPDKIMESVNFLPSSVGTRCISCVSRPTKTPITTWWVTARRLAGYRLCRERILV